jgi:hypothetical protein
MLQTVTSSEGERAFSAVSHFDRRWARVWEFFDRIYRIYRMGGMEMYG